LVRLVNERNKELHFIGLNKKISKYRLDRRK
jgi:hypothetical protein